MRQSQTICYRRRRTQLDVLLRSPAALIVQPTRLKSRRAGTNSSPPLLPCGRDSSVSGSHIPCFRRLESPKISKSKRVSPSFPLTSPFPPLISCLLRFGVPIYTDIAMFFSPIFLSMTISPFEIRCFRLFSGRENGNSFWPFRCSVPLSPHSVSPHPSPTVLHCNSPAIAAEKFFFP